MLRPTEQLKELAISETGLIFDPSSGFIYTANPVALAVLEALRKGEDRSDISSFLIQRYDVEAAVIERDLFDFFKQLSDYGMVSYEKL